MEYYTPEKERAIRWDDPEIGIVWPIPDWETPKLSAKDLEGKMFREADLF